MVLRLPRRSRCCCRGLAAARATGMFGGAMRGIALALEQGAERAPAGERARHLAAARRGQDRRRRGAGARVRRGRTCGAARRRRPRPRAAAHLFGDRRPARADRPHRRAGRAGGPRPNGRGDGHRLHPAGRSRLPATARPRVARQAPRLRPGDRADPRHRQRAGASAAPTPRRWPARSSGRSSSRAGAGRAGTPSRRRSSGSRRSARTGSSSSINMVDPRRHALYGFKDAALFSRSLRRYQYARF